MGLAEYWSFLQVEAASTVNRNPHPDAKYGLALSSHMCTSLTSIAEMYAVRNARALRPNPSLKRSANGRPPGPAWWYAVHFHQSGPSVLPLAPA